MSLLDYTAVELAAKIKAGETTATEAMEAVIAWSSTQDCT